MGNSITSTKFTHLFFDLDGTLIDSEKDLTVALNKMRRHYSLAPVSNKKVASIIGKGMPSTTKKVLSIGFPPELVDQYAAEALTLTLQYYDAELGKHTQVYPNVTKVLDTLKSLNIPMAIVTNKEEAHTTKLLSLLSLTPYFNCIVGGDTTDFYKPHKAPLSYACKQLNAPIENSLMIGDSENDLLCAQAMGIKCALLSYGYESNFNRLKPDILLTDFADLMDHVQS